MARSTRRVSAAGRAGARRPHAARLFGVAFGLIACRTSEPAPTSEERALRSQRPAAAAANAPTSAPVACGEPGMAECPTQHWMKATLQAYLRTHDYKRLAASFEELAAHAPAGYDRWQQMAQSGARAAARQDEDQVRKVCQDCHDQHRTTFRREMRTAQLW
jgi:hypothetical protein